LPPRKLKGVQPPNSGTSTPTGYAT
jgi:hypothetical protein